MKSRLAGLGLLAASTLMIEVGLTRLFSVLFYPPFVFTILSLAVLGIGLGAGGATWQAGARRPHRIPLYMALASISTLFICFAGLRLFLPFPQVTLTLLILPPFIFVGLALATIFSQEAEKSPYLYLADLGGAGAGALLVVPLFDTVDVVGGLVLSAALLGIGALVLDRGWRRWPAWLAAGLPLLLVVLHARTGWLSPDLSRLPAEKPVAEVLGNGGRVLASNWDAFARTDLLDPGNGSPYQLYMDGAAGSVMPPSPEGSVAEDLVLGDIGFFPFATEQPRRVFIVGPGGGMDVRFGLRSGADTVVAVEVNPASVEMVHRYGDYNGHLYSDPAVRVVVDEGRSVLAREEHTYDLIFLSQIVTLAAERSGYALVENSTYTVEAFQAYFDHLSEEGLIALKLYDEPTLTRALSTALAALKQRGRSGSSATGQDGAQRTVQSRAPTGQTLSDAEALTHIIALVDSSADPPIPLLMVRSTPFDREDALSIGAVARQVGFTPLFLPHVLAQPPLDAVAAGERAFSDVVAESESDIRPTRDDRPFFFQFERGIPRGLQGLLWALAGVVVGGVVLLRVGQGRVVDPAPVEYWIYFGALGFGFMAVEIGLIQQTRLFLGHPTVAITTVLATVLIGGGVGSGLAGWRVISSSTSTKSRTSFPSWPPVAVAVCLALWLLLWPWLRQTFLGAEQVWRISVIVLSLLPLVLFMGMPFPLGLRMVGGFGGGQVALAWTVNGVSSVVGSVGAVVTAILYGYSWVMIAGIGVYLVAGLAVWRVRARRDAELMEANDLDGEIMDEVAGMV